MFANMDYPEADPQFMAAVEREAAQVLDELGGRPSLAVLCGSSEIAQQVAMLGLDPELASGPLFGELLPTPRGGVGARCDLRRIRAVGARAPVPPRPRRRELLRRRRLPATDRGCTPGRGRVRGRVPGVRQRARRGRARRDRAADSSCTTRVGRPGCRATSAPAGTSTTFATTISERCSASRGRRCAGATRSATSSSREL